MLAACGVMPAVESGRAAVESGFDDKELLELGDRLLTLAKSSSSKDEYVRALNDRSKTHSHPPGMPGPSRALISGNECASCA